MAEENRLSAALAENILTLLCFDKQRALLVRAAISPRDFESSVFRKIAEKAVDYLDQFKEPIGEHVADELEDILSGNDSRLADTYKRVLDNLFLARESTNGEYVLSQVHRWVRQQNLKGAFVEAVEAFESGDLDKAEVALQKGLDNQVVAFEPGLNLSDTAQALTLLSDPHEEGISTGIDEFDKIGFQLRRKTLTTLIGAYGTGKSWSCVHMAKMALLQRWSVVIYTMEMSQKEYALRLVQSFLSMSVREADVVVARFVKDKKGELADINFEEVVRKSLDDSQNRKEAISRVQREFGRRPPLIIKEFPSGSLTTAAMEAHLDGLERFHKITPDLIIVDYPDLMKHDVKNKRLELGQLFVDLRGIMGKRNCAGYAPTQGNRDAADASVVTGDMVAEDYSKNNTADQIMTYSQTAEEQKIGLARLYIDKNRTGPSKRMVLISQSYDIGQYCLDSVRHRGNYFQMINQSRPTDPPPPSRRARN